MGMGPTELLLISAICVGWLVALVVIAALVAMFLRRRPPPPPSEDELKINLAELDDQGPPDTPPRLECYGVPVRLALVLVAPLGRSSVAGGDQLAALLDRLVPGLAGVFAAHRPKVQYWPPQLSPRGFAHLFHAQAALPGDKGKGSPWAAITGKCEYQGQGAVVGMLLHGEGPNGLGQIDLERETQWLDVLRVRREV